MLIRHWSIFSLVPRPPHSFCRLQYEKRGERGNEASQYHHHPLFKPKIREVCVCSVYNGISMYM